MVLTLIETEPNGTETRKELEFIEITTPDKVIPFYDSQTNENIFFIIPDDYSLVINYMDRNQSLDMFSSDWIMRLRIVYKKSDKIGDNTSQQSLPKTD